MFTFNLLNILEITKFKKVKSKHRPPFFDTRYEPPSPGEIRQTIEKLSRCPNCQFLIFDGYWSSEIEQLDVKVCPTCGIKM